MTMHCIKVCEEKKITYLSFALQFITTKIVSQMTNQKQMWYIECVQMKYYKKSRDKSLYILKKAILFQITRDVYQRGI